MLVDSVLPPLFQELLHIRLDHEGRFAGQMVQIKRSSLLRPLFVGYGRV